MNPFLMGPLAFLIIFGPIGFYFALRERAEDRKRKEEEARRIQASRPDQQGAAPSKSV
jgi:hypothetical protein